MWIRSIGSPLPQHKGPRELVRGETHLRQNIAWHLDLCPGFAFNRVEEEMGKAEACYKGFKLKLPLL